MKMKELRAVVMATLIGSKGIENMTNENRSMLMNSAHLTATNILEHVGVLKTPKQKIAKPTKKEKKAAKRKMK